MPFKPTNPKISFPELEKEILKFWEEKKIFEKSLEKNPKDRPYTFYDGPPFATGTPHYGHLVASLIKDSIPRYWTMKGYYVERRWGWDCHGLPIENIVEKELGFKSKKDIEEWGIDKFNEACRSKVLLYVDEWKKIIPRFGRWADMENPYSTMDLNYMESIWWAFKKLWEEGLIYEGYKSMHVCPRCETTLSQQEVSEGYKDIKDLSVTAKFELAKDPGTFILAWTTTPWTLPGNVALAVGDDIDYVKVEKKELEKGEEKERYILAKERLTDDLKEKFKVIDEFKGASLVGKNYLPLFSYYLEKEIPNKENLYTVQSASFVTTSDGTGVVHIAPAYGEDDMNLGKEKNLPFIQNVELSGVFKPEVTDFAGLHVKPMEDTQKTDVEILKHLAAKNLVFSKEKYEHSYPHCWRCDTPLINYATSSWFVNVTKIKGDLIKNAQEINWSPSHIKEGRFGQWLEGAHDWSISRQRFWASCIPIWKCKCGGIKVVGGIKELEGLSGTKVTDLHKHIIDKVTFDCEKCGEKMQRIPDVLDCWFESGSMPYAQEHYPFENKEKFEKGFPAQFIAEGIDQTRAWFYYLHVISGGIKNSEAFKNVIVNGIVLAEDGKKMSKRLQNYPDPQEVMEKYGADAMRYYLLSSPVMLAENLNFSESGVRETNQKIVILLNNILNFYKLYSSEKATEKVVSENILDRWILSRQQNLLKTVTKNMESYSLPHSVRPIGDFIDELSTWWLRRSRDRLKSEGKDQKESIATLRHVLLELSKIMAPFTPFLAEFVYGEAGGEKESVHLEDWPEADGGNINENLEKDMATAQKIVEAGHAQRKNNSIKVRQPLNKAVVSGVNDLGAGLNEIILDELNIKSIEYSNGEELKVELDMDITPELKAEGDMREIVRLIQDARKEAKYAFTDAVNCYYQTDSADIKDVIAKYSEEIKKQTILSELVEGAPETKDIDKEGKISDNLIHIFLKR